MKKIVVVLFIGLILTACQQVDFDNEPTTTFVPTLTPVPTSELTPYYGSPLPVKIIVNDKTYVSEIGTTMWVHIDSDGNQITEIGDAFAIITPTQPIVTKSPFLFNLKLPIPINPTMLWYVIYDVSNEDILQDQNSEIYRWILDSQEHIVLPLLVEQQLNFSLDSGIYVLEVHAGWGAPQQPVELDADYGFLIEIEE